VRSLCLYLCGCLLLQPPSPPVATVNGDAAWQSDVRGDDISPPMWTCLSRTFNSLRRILLAITRGGLTSAVRSSVRPSVRPLVRSSHTFARPSKGATGWTCHLSTESDQGPKEAPVLPPNPTQCWPLLSFIATAAAASSSSRSSSELSVRIDVLPRGHSTSFDKFLVSMKCPIEFVGFQSVARAPLTAKTKFRPADHSRGCGFVRSWRPIAEP
jgi:hypothetical protein